MHVPDGAASRRYHELDSLRGVAAFTVLVFHFAMIFPIIAADTTASSDMLWLNIFKYSPLRILFAGSEAVLLFFVLSGFVLSLQFKPGRRVRYPTFIIRRLCRIYLPYAAAVALAFTLHSVIRHVTIVGLSSEVSSVWTTPITWPTIISHITFIVGNVNWNASEGVIWSLIFEMRISVIFPLVMLMVNRLRWQISLSIGVLLYVFAFSQNILFGNDIATDPYYTIFTTHNQYLDTCIYLLCFILGAILAKHITEIARFYQGLTSTGKVLIVGLTILGFTYGYLWPLNTHHRITQRSITYLFNTAGASLAIILALASPRFSRFLMTKPIVFLGKISYSLYLCHFIVLISSIYLLHKILPIWAILSIAFVLSFALATLAYHLVERPSITLGKRLTKPKNNVLSARVSY